MLHARHFLTVPLALGAFIATFFAVGKLMLFLSLPSGINGEHAWLLLDNRSRIEIAVIPITIDTILVISFILQHSLMRSKFVKTIWSTLNLQTAERSVYNLATAGTLWYLLSNWRLVPSLVLWNIDVEARPVLWWTFVVTHSVAWTIIYGGSVIMDLPELLGIKQVYYDITGLFTPLLYKSRNLSRLYGHIRHPSFLGLTIILWATNVMSLDRLLLSILWTLYMYVAWNTDAQDVAYQRNQFGRKRHEILY